METSTSEQEETYINMSEDEMDTDTSEEEQLIWKGKATQTFEPGDYSGVRQLLKFRVCGFVTIVPAVACEFRAT